MPPAKSASQIPSGNLEKKQGGDIGYSADHPGVHIMIPLGEPDEVFLLENGVQASLPYKVFFKLGK